MRSSLRSKRALSASMLLACIAATGCANTSNRWVQIEPHGPSHQATTVGINAKGSAWFFQCDEQTIMTGLRIADLTVGPEVTQKVLSIKFDAEPTEQYSWQVEKNAYVMRGEGVTALARRTALAYDAIVEVDGVRSAFSLAGSHMAMIEMTRSCPFLAVK